ncbi:hypothetical protein [Paenibacillus turpanensis]|uniref:hypothetical protein n=1 Tax=Paenibacillus turpanensis TaxID=2689078 RepID=UPI0014083CB9|nr:hypothetical protein [Paenibacillus turpanensis]
MWRSGFTSPYDARRLELQLSILESLAASQKAVTKMIESVADQTVEPKFELELVSHVQAIASYQRALADKLAAIEPGLLPRRLKRGVPAAPWLSFRYTEGRRAHD